MTPNEKMYFFIGCILGTTLTGVGALIQIIYF